MKKEILTFCSWQQEASQRNSEKQSENEDLKAKELPNTWNIWISTKTNQHSPNEFYQCSAWLPHIEKRKKKKVRTVFYSWKKFNFLFPFLKIKIK